MPLYTISELGSVSFREHWENDVGVLTAKDRETGKISPVSEGVALALLKTDPSGVYQVSVFVSTKFPLLAEAAEEAFNLLNAPVVDEPAPMAFVQEPVFSQPYTLPGTGEEPFPMGTTTPDSVIPPAVTIAHEETHFTPAQVPVSMGETTPSVQKAGLGLALVAGLFLMGAKK